MGARRASIRIVRRGVGLVLLCQDAGFSLPEIRALVERRAQRDARRALLAGKLDAIDRQIRALRAARRAIAHAMTRPAPDATTCPKLRRLVEKRRVRPGAKPSHLRSARAE